MPQDLQLGQDLILFGLDYNVVKYNYDCAVHLNYRRGTNAEAFARAGLLNERHALGQLYYGIASEMNPTNNWPNLMTGPNRVSYPEVTRLYNFLKSLEALQCLAQA